MNCTNCGKELGGVVKFCDGCGTPVISEQENKPTPAQPMQTAETSPANKESENKVIFILSYLGILFFLPLVSCPHSKIGRFHANQSLLLLIASVAGQIIISVLSSILLAISWRLWAITSLLSWAWAIAILALVILGMVNANKGEQKPLPVIGKWKLIK